MSLLVVYSILVIAASLAGGLVPTFWRWNHRTMQGVMSFVGGVMLGIGLLHLLPHSVSMTGSSDQTARATLVGLIAIFLLIRVFHVHQHPSYPDECCAEHDHPEEDHWHDELDAPLVVPAPPRLVDSAESETTALSAAAVATRHRLTWVGLFAGMTLHTMLDGVALAAALSHRHGAVGLIGLGTFVAVFLHKPLDALSITSLMAAGGWSVRWQRRVNLLFSLLCPVAAFAFYFGVEAVPATVPLVGWALGFSAGVFLCISLADILPEIQFHAHDRLLLTSVLLLGVFVAWLVGFLEPAHLHAH